MSKMELGKAVALVKQLDNGDYTEDEYIKAIDTVANMETIMSVKKDELHKALQYVVRRIPTWIYCDETEPIFNDEYLVCFDDGYVCVAYYNGTEWELWANAGEVIAWMNVPNPCRLKGE